MLYKFKSKATGDLIMLEPNGRHALQIIGKEPGPKGIIQVQEMQGAIAALQQAIVDDETQREAERQTAQAEGREIAVDEAISLRRRLVPMIDMLQRCHKEKADVVWGV